MGGRQQWCQLAGTLAVVRTQRLSPVPYTGTVEITSGEIAEDLAVYLAESEQTNSAIALGVQILPDGSVAGAGGYFIQVLFQLLACRLPSWTALRSLQQCCCIAKCPVGRGALRDVPDCVVFGT